MRRIIHGIILTILWMFTTSLLIGWNSIVMLMMFFEGLGLSFLWDVGVISNIKKLQKEYASVKREEQ